MIQVVIPRFGGGGGPNSGFEGRRGTRRSGEGMRGWWDRRDWRGSGNRGYQQVPWAFLNLTDMRHGVLKGTTMCQIQAILMSHVFVSRNAHVLSLNFKEHLDCISLKYNSTMMTPISY